MEHKKADMSSQQTSELGGHNNGTSKKLSSEHDRLASSHQTPPPSTISHYKVQQAPRSKQQEQQSHQNKSSMNPSHRNPQQNKKKLVPKSSSQQRRWTDTNSDKHCIQNTQNIFSRMGYTLSLATGFYAIEPLDKRLSMILGYALLIIFILLTFVFYRGVQDGLASMETVVQTTSEMAFQAAASAVASGEMTAENVDTVTNTLDDVNMVQSEL